MIKKSEHYFFWMSLLLYFPFHFWVFVQESHGQEIPRNVWSYWDHDLPEDIEEMVDSQRRSLKNFTYILLAAENLSSLLDDIPPGFERLTGNNKGDFVRVALVEKYGGFWVDASMYINSDEGIEFFYSKSSEVKSQIIGIGPGSMDGQLYHPWTFFFGAPRNSTFMKIWAEESYKAVKMGLHQYQKSVFKQFPDIFRHIIWFNLDLTLDVISETHSEAFSKMVMVFISPANKNSPHRLMSECEKEFRECLKRAKKTKRSRKERKKCPNVFDIFKNRLRNDPKVRKYPFIKMGHLVRIGRKLQWNEEKMEEEF